MIYFIKCEKDSYDIKAGFIKIGTTVRLSVRLKQIADELDHTPTVLAVLDGAFAEERALHEKFKLARRYGEWFHPAPELLWLIETEARPWDGIDEQETVTTTIRCRKEYRDWLNEFARKERLTPTQLIDFGLVELAKLKKNPLPPRPLTPAPAHPSGRGVRRLAPCLNPVFVLCMLKDQGISTISTSTGTPAAAREPKTNPVAEHATTLPDGR